LSQKSGWRKRKEKEEREERKGSAIQTVAKALKEWELGKLL